MVTITGHRLQELRTKKRMTATKIAALLGVARGTYYNYERGQRVMGAPLLLRAAEVLGTSVDYLVGLTDDPMPTSASMVRLREKLMTLEAARQESQAILMDVGADPSSKHRAVETLAVLTAEMDRLRALLSKEQPRPEVSTIRTVRRLPLVGSIRAGSPTLSQESVRGMVSVPEDFSADWCLTVYGDSMEPDISSGDVVICQDVRERGLSIESLVNKVVVVATNNGHEEMGYTLKTLIKVEPPSDGHLLGKDGRVEPPSYRLHASNPAYGDIPLRAPKETSDLYNEIRGVVVGRIMAPSTGIDAGDEELVRRWARELGPEKAMRRLLELLAGEGGS